MRHCSIQNCLNKHYCKNFCNKHHTRWLRHGDPSKTQYIVDPNSICKVKNCLNKYYGKGFCKRHYSKYRYNLNPEVIMGYNLRRLEKFGRIFDMNSMEFQYALQSWSKSIKTRDKSCQVCGSKYKLNAHHMFYPQLSLNLNNGITLCDTCHEELHGFKIYT